MPNHAAFTIREFQRDDKVEVDALALRAFEQFKETYGDWPAFKARINVSALAEVGEVIVAEMGGRIAGAVAYLGPGAKKAEFFVPEWPIMRMLVVSPDARGLGIGRALAEDCIRRAKRDGATKFALHTSELMHVALPMYLRMGFIWNSNAPSIHGVAYSVYVKELQKQNAG